MTTVLCKESTLKLRLQEFTREMKSCDASETNTLPEVRAKAENPLRNRRDEKAQPKPGSSKIVNIKVTQPKLHGCNTKKFVDYEITIETNNKAFFRKFSCVRRRYSDFCWLRAKLCSTEINGFGMNRTVPYLPPKNYFGRFSKEVVDTRQQGLQDFLKEIVKVDDFLSFAGLHLFLQTQLPVQEIDGFLEGKYGEHASVEELIDTHELANASEDKVEYVCSSEKCALMTTNWDIPSPAITTSESDDVSSAKSLSSSYNSSDSLLGPISSSVESSSFMYTVYR